MSYLEGKSIKQHDRKALSFYGPGHFVVFLQMCLWVPSITHSQNDFPTRALIMEPVFETKKPGTESARDWQRGTFYATAKSATKRWKTGGHGIPEALWLPM